MPASDGKLNLVSFALFGFGVIDRVAVLDSTDAREDGVGVVDCIDTDITSTLCNR